MPGARSSTSAHSKALRCAMPRTEVHRGDIWLASFGAPVGRKQAGRRPALVVSTDLLNHGPAGVAIVVPLTTTRRDLPTHVEVAVGTSGLDEVSYAKCEDVKSISVEGLVTRLGDAGVEVMHDVA